MTAETQTYAQELRWLLEQICVSLKGLSAAQLNWRPDTGSANSAYSIGAHVAAVTRVYALGFGCGRAVQHDRSTEFAASGTDAGPLIARREALAAEITSALADLAPSALDRCFVPPRELWG